MIPPTFTIETDPARAFLHLTLAGDWNEAIVERFGAAVTVAIRDMIARGAKPGQFVTLIDMRQKNILPQNVATEFARLVRPDSPSKRIAMLVSGAVHRMQPKRIGNDGKRFCFDSETAARNWLFAPGDGVEPPVAAA